MLSQGYGQGKAFVLIFYTCIGIVQYKGPSQEGSRFSQMNNFSVQGFARIGASRIRLKASLLFRGSYRCIDAGSY